MGQNAPQPVPSTFQKSMSLRHLEAYLASLPDAIMVWDRAGKLLFRNAAALTLLEIQDADAWLDTSAQQFLQRYEWYDEQQRPFSSPHQCSLSTNSSWTSFVRFWRAGA